MWRWFINIKDTLFDQILSTFSGSAAYCGLDLSNDDSLGISEESRNGEVLLVNDDIKMVDWVDIVRSVGVTDRGVSPHTPHLELNSKPTSMLRT